MPAKSEPAETPTPRAPLAWRGRLLALLGPLAWGAAAAFALTAVLLVAQTRTGAERLNLAFLQTREPEPQAVAPLPPRVVVDAEETRRLAAAVRELVADRKRLDERIATLEHNLDDMTGSIKTVMQANTAVQSAKELPKIEQAPKEKLAVIAPPVVSAPEVTTPAAVPAAMPALPPPPPPPPAAAKTAAASPPAIDTKIIAPGPPPPGAEPVQTDAVPLPPLPPIRIASAAVPAAQPAKTEYGVDLGGAFTVGTLRGEWSRVKANFGPLIAGLRPLAAPRQRPNGAADYRLIVGPLPTHADAMKLCARFNAARAVCHTAKFTGEELAQR